MFTSCRFCAERRKAGHGTQLWRINNTLLVPIFQKAATDLFTSNLNSASGLQGWLEKTDSCRQRERGEGGGGEREREKVRTSASLPVHVCTRMILWVSSGHVCARTCFKWTSEIARKRVCERETETETERERERDRERHRESTKKKFWLFVCLFFFNVKTTNFGSKCMLLFYFKFHFFTCASAYFHQEPNQNFHVYGFYCIPLSV